MTEHPYRLVGRLKNNRLWEAILMRYPETRSQADAARLLGLNGAQFGKLLNMGEFPYSTRRQCYTSVAVKIAEQLNYPADWLFDPALYGRPLRIDIPITPKTLPGISAQLAIAAPQDADVMKREAKTILTRGLNRLTPRQRFIVALRYGLNGEDEHTLAQVAQKFAVSVERIRAIEGTAIRRLKWYVRAANKFTSVKELLP